MRELKGIYSAIVTPFDGQGDFDPAAMRRIVRYQMEAGVHGFYICGGTGEGLLLTREERQQVLETVLDETQGRAGVIAHIGAYHTPETIALARHASQVGADAIAALPPAYFYTPDTIGLIKYYKAVAAASQIPLLVYNIPQRLPIRMTQELFDQLMQIPNIVGMKDSSGDIYSLSLFFRNGKQPVIFEGDDPSVLAALMAGACGGIGATYNMMPEHFVKLWQQFQAKDYEGAARTQYRINELVNALLVVNLFGGLKQLLAWMGLPCGEPRSPNRALTEEETARLRRSLESVGFLKGD